jgi:hypothetical protein
MKFSVILLVVATLLLLAGLGIRMHANGKYMDKMYYHTIDSGLYNFDEVFAERKLGNTLQTSGVVAAVAGGIWFVVIAMKRRHP